MKKNSDKDKTFASKNLQRRQTDSIDEASKESFPTSDPPAWTLGTDTDVTSFIKQNDKSLSSQLASDHLLLRNIIKLIKKAIHNLQTPQAMSAEELIMMSDFLCIFLDKIHRQKEECLYPELQAGEKGLTAYMLTNLRDEHAYGSNLLTQLNQLTKQTLPTSEKNKQAILSLLQEIEHFYNNHLAKEEEYVLPFIKDAINEEMQQNFLKVYAQIEEKYQPQQVALKKLTDDVT